MCISEEDVTLLHRCNFVASSWYLLTSIAPCYRLPAPHGFLVTLPYTVQWRLVPVFLSSGCRCLCTQMPSFFVSGCVECKQLSTNFSVNLQPAALFFSSPPIFQIFCGSGSGQLICSFTMVHIHQTIIDGHPYQKKRIQ
jgi:hypothetical protein